MEKCAGLIFDLLNFAGKIKNHLSGILLQGKHLALITKTRRTHPLYKISSKTLTSK